MNQILLQEEEEVVVEADPVLPPSPSREIRRSPVAYPQGLSVPLGQYSGKSTFPFSSLPGR